MNTQSTLRRGLAIATVVSALGAPAASAAPVEQFSPSTTNSEAGAPVDYSKNSATGAYAPDREIYVNPSTGFPGSDAAAEATSPAPVRVVQAGADNGFDWGDAGIGAGGLLALAAIASGALVAIRHRPGARHTVA